MQGLPAIEAKIAASKYFDIVEKLRNYLQSEASSLKDFKDLSFEAWRYRAIRQYYVENSHPAIVDKETWKLVQKKITAEHKRKTGA